MLHAALAPHWMAAQLRKSAELPDAWWKDPPRSTPPPETVLPLEMYSQLQGCTCHGDSSTRPGLQTCCLPGPPLPLKKASAVPLKSAEPYEPQTNQTSSHLRRTAGLNPSTKILPEPLTPSLFKNRPLSPDRYAATEMDLEYQKPHHHAAAHPYSAEQLSARRELFTSCETFPTTWSPPP